MRQQANPSWEKTSLRLPRGRNYDPFDHAEQLGLQVLIRSLRDHDELWLPDHFTIVLSKRLRAVAQREACAHGIGHAALGHEDDRPKHEHQADLYSSLYLIDPVELRELSSWTNDMSKISSELGVTRQLLEVYLRWAS